MQDRWHGTDWDIRQKTWKQIRVEVIKRGGEGKKRERSEMWKSSLWNVAQPHFLPNVKNSSQFVWTTLLKENTPRILPHLPCSPQGCLHQRRRGFIFHQREASWRDSEGVWWGNSEPQCVTIKVREQLMEWQFLFMSHGAGPDVAAGCGWN